MKKAESFYTAPGCRGRPRPRPRRCPYTIFRQERRSRRRHDGDAARADAEAGAVALVSYFQVDDADAAVKKASALGAKVHMPPTDIPGTGRFAVLADPQGANFALIKIRS